MAEPFRKLNLKARARMLVVVAPERTRRVRLTLRVRRQPHEGPQRPSALVSSRGSAAAMKPPEPSLMMAPTAP